MIQKIYRLFAYFHFILLLLFLLSQGVTAWQPAYAAPIAQARSAQTNEHFGVVRGNGATVLDASLQASAETLSAGALVIVLGRSEDSSLLYVLTEDQQSGWVAAGSLLIVNVSSLPVFTLQSRLAAEEGNPSAEGAEPDSTEPDGSETLTSTNVLAIPTPRTPSKSTGTKSTVTQTAFENGLDAVVTLETGRLNLRSGPGAMYEIVGKAEPNSKWRAIGRDERGDWLQVVSSAGGQPVWAAAAYLTLKQPSISLPIPAQIPPPPTPQPIVYDLLPTPTAVAASVGSGTTGSNSVPASLPVANKTGLSGKLAFQDRIGGTIYFYDLDTDTQRTLTSGVDPAISPDGRMVAFTRDGGGRGIYVINTDGTGERRLFNDAEIMRSPKWSPDGRWILFSRSNGYEDCRLVSGGCLADETILGSFPEDLQGEMNVEKMVKDLPNQRVYRFTLSRIGADGNDYRDIPSEAVAAAPDWSDTGIVYQSRAGIQRTEDRPDAVSVQVANDNLHGYFHDPDVQPGGSRIVFQRKQASHWQIYAVNSDGSGLVALTRPVTAMADELPSSASPAWSFDGKQILYVSNRNSIESAGAWHFWVMNADGSNQRLLPIDVVVDYTFSSEQMVSWVQ